MSTFALNKMSAVQGRQTFQKLVQDNVCLFDAFETELEDCYKSELIGIYATMNDVANLKSVPKTKYHFYDKAKGVYREFEFKSRHLRVFGITAPNGKIIILGGTKAKQNQVQKEFRHIKDCYLNSIK